MHLLNEESVINYWYFLVAKAHEAVFLEGQYRNETDAEECYSGEHSRDWSHISSHCHYFSPSLIITVI